MSLRKFLVFGITTIGTAIISAACHAADPVRQNALIPVKSRHLDELRLAPSVDLPAYRRIMIDPVQVEFHDDWLRNMNSRRRTARRLTPDDVRQIADEMRSGLRQSLEQAFVQRGYTFADRSGPGVLTLSATARDLYVNAPDALSAPVTKTFAREVGTATLVLEARDSVSGALLAVAVRHGTADRMARVERSSDAATRFWFSVLFDRYASQCAMELQANRTRAQTTLPSAATQ